MAIFIIGALSELVVARIWSFRIDFSNGPYLCECFGISTDSFVWSHCCLHKGALPSVSQELKSQGDLFSQSEKRVSGSDKVMRMGILLYVLRVRMRTDLFFMMSRFTCTEKMTEFVNDYKPTLQVLEMGRGNYIKLNHGPYPKAKTLSKTPL